MPLVKISGLNKCRGVSLIEVLISIVLVSIVLLGAAGMALTSMNENQSAYYRSQANALAYDMADRIRLNSGFALLDDDNYEFNSGIVADIPSAVACPTAVGGCSSSDQASQDLREWAENFIDLAGIGVDGAGYQALIPNAVGQIVRNDANPEQFTVTISWQESDWNVSGGNNKGNKSHQLDLSFRVFN